MKGSVTFLGGREPGGPASYNQGDGAAPLALGGHPPASFISVTLAPERIGKVTPAPLPQCREPLSEQVEPVRPQASARSPRLPFLVSAGLCPGGYDFLRQARRVTLGRWLSTR